ncbi:MAG TPA: TIGR03364 family FAD-dependent oxidoreductase [Cyclobacteriaceae bacterium]
MTNSNNNSADIAIVGAGIVGLAHAYMALRKGYRVVLFEREQFAIGASVRNFGLIWPIGQEPGVGLDRALRSRNHWIEVAKEAGFWINPNGSLHVVYHDDEMDVLNEFQSLYKDAGYSTQLLDAAGVHLKSESVKNDGLKGGLWNAADCTVNPREAIRRIPLWLEEKYGLMLRFGNVVTEVGSSKVKTARETWRADKVFICNGADFETLYPKLFDAQPVSKCKLQMMKAVSSIPNFKLGPSLCAGLTLRHYAAFSKCPSLQKVDERYDKENINYKNDGVHILLSQNSQGELIIGDSHHYGKTMEPFDKEEINELILDYLHSFTELGVLTITERWNGIYPKVKGNINLIMNPEPGVTIVNGLGGAGMTLSFGLAEEIVGKL